MDTSTTSSSIAHSLITHPASLYIGNRQAMVAQVVESIQRILCLRQGCYTCITCRNIAQGSHHALLWLTTEKHYTLEDVQRIHDALRFSLESTQHFFIVIEQAERLNDASANSLLTGMEEPPAGYHFILIVENSDQLLPTIRSRCIIQVNQANTQRLQGHSLFPFFTVETAPDPLIFLQELEQCNPHEQETMALVDALITHWHTACKKHIHAGNQAALKHAQATLHLLIESLEKPPMPGSSKLFWKNLLLSFTALCSLRNK